MPELPEVEVVRRGLDRWVAGRTVASAAVLHPRAARRHEAGGDDLAARLVGRTILTATRRGKYLWLPLDGRGSALVAHLGMSGQLLVQPRDSPDETHLRARITFTDGGRELRFVDQRTFGGLALDDLVPDDADGRVPASVAHIARDPLDPLFDDAPLREAAAVAPDGSQAGPARPDAGRAASATSTRTSRCGGRGCTGQRRPTPSRRPEPASCSATSAMS